MQFGGGWWAPALRGAMNHRQLALRGPICEFFSPLWSHQNNKGVACEGVCCRGVRAPPGGWYPVTSVISGFCVGASAVCRGTAEFCGSLPPDINNAVGDFSASTSTSFVPHAVSPSPSRGPGFGCGHSLPLRCSPSDALHPLPCCWPPFDA